MKYSMRGRIYGVNCCELPAKLRCGFNNVNGVNAPGCISSD